MGFVIFVPGGRPPNAEEVLTAAGKLGLELQVEPYDPVSQTGSLPVTVDGVEGAFEYYADEIARYLEDVGDEYSFFERMSLRLRFVWAISLILHSRLDDLFVASRFAAAMTVASRGHLMDLRGKYLTAQQLAPLLAKIPPPKNLAARDGIAAHVYAALDRIITRLGYLAIEPLERGSRWHWRGGAHFASEFIVSAAYFDGDESYCALDFCGSDLTVAELRSRGTGSIIGLNLSQWTESALPRNIVVGADFDTKTLPQIEGELAAADRTLWTRLISLAATHDD